jgi:hypothetical protein
MLVKYKTVVTKAWNDGGNEHPETSHRELVGAEPCCLFMLEAWDDWIDFRQGAYDEGEMTVRIVRKIPDYDGYSTEAEVIFFCPFCGKAIAIQEAERAERTAHVQKREKRTVETDVTYSERKVE